MRTGEERHVKQFQYSNWAESDKPNVSSLLEFRRRIRASYDLQDGPLLVHCGSGGGRTATFLAIDAVLRRASIDNKMDIFNYIRYLMTCRQNFFRLMVLIRIISW